MAAFLLLPMVAQADASYGDEWSSIKKTLGNAYKAETTDESLQLLSDAEAIYNNVFSSAAQEHDMDTHNVILGCYDAAEEAYKAGDKKQAKLWIQCQEKSVYTIGMVMMEVSLAEDDASKYLDWSKVVQKKFKVADKDPATQALFTAIKNDPSQLGIYSDVIRENMLDIFELKTVEELEEALIKYGEDDTYSAKKYAYEGLYYYQTLHPYATESIGSDKANQLYGLMEKAMDISDSANDGVSVADLTAQMKDTKKEVEKIVMEHNGIDGTPEALALAGIADRLYLVQVEYVDAIDGSGNIINDMEYAETVAFAGGALEISEENADVLNAISSSELAELQSILTGIIQDVDNKESISQVLNAADDATVIVKSMQAHTGEAGSNLTGYFDTINRLLLSAEAAHSNGDSDLAFDLVSQAYLDNYEFLEAPIGEVDVTLMKTIEDNMREELRNMIKSGQSASSVQSQIQMINSDLDKAQSKVTTPQLQLGEDWAAIKKTLGNAYKAETTDESLKLVSDAKAIYQSSFAAAAQMHDANTHNVILGCYDAAEEAYKAGDKKQAKLWIQCQEKSVYTIGMVMMEVSLAEDDASKYLDWSKVVQKKFKVADKDPATQALFTAIKNDPSQLGIYSDVIRENMLDIFELKTVEELEEALIKYGEDDTYSAKKYAYEGLYYYQTLHPYATESIGSDKANQLYGLMEKAMDISDSANDGVSVADLTAQMKDTKKEVEKIVMEHNGIDGTPEALALAGIADRLYLVQVEYVDAIDGSGNIINDMEYAETVAFAGGALEISEENADVLNAISSSELAELQSILTGIIQDVDNKESISQVLNAADDATVIVKSMQAHTGEAGSNLTGYFDTINRLLLSAQAAYSNGNSDLAFELVSQAYLDNYEFLEAPIGEVNPSLMKTIEDNMREELRNMIQSGVSYTEIKTQILFILADLETAQAAVTTVPTVSAAPTPVVATQESTEEGGGCLIATAAYGSELAPQVQQLREIRDNQLMNTESGSAFMSTFNELYYTFSPTIADMERESPVFKEIVKAGLTPMLSTLAIMENAESESEVLGLGLSVIALNLGMYLGAPAIIIIGIRKRF